MKALRFPLLALMAVTGIAVHAQPAPPTTEIQQVPPAAGAVTPPDAKITVTGPNQRQLLERYIGRYALNGTIITVEFTDDGGLTLYRTGESAGPAWRMVSENSFVSDPRGVRVFFEGDGDQATRIRSQYLGSEVVGDRIP